MLEPKGAIDKDGNPQYQAKEEKRFVRRELHGYDPSDSEAWKLLTARFGQKISQEQLLALAVVVSRHLHIALFREYKRRKSMLIKWFDENLYQVWPFIVNHIVIVDASGNQIIENNRMRSPNFPYNYNF